MPALALEMLPQTQAHWITLLSPSVYGLSCGRWKYSEPFQLDCVPRKVFMSHSTSMPSAAKKPSCWATKSFRPIPLGATRTFLMAPPVTVSPRRYRAAPRYTSALRAEARPLRGLGRLGRRVHGHAVEVDHLAAEPAGHGEHGDRDHREPDRGIRDAAAALAYVGVHDVQRDHGEVDAHVDQ